PKGVVLSHGALCWQGLNAMHEYGFTHTSVYLHTAPLFHLADFAATLGVNAAGARHVFLPEFTANAVIDADEHQGADTAILVPTMVPMVLDAARDRMPALRGLRRILYGAAPIQEPVLRRLCEALPEVQLFQVYGQTECGGACTVL